MKHTSVGSATISFTFAELKEQMSKLGENTKIQKKTAVQLHSGHVQLKTRQCRFSVTKPIRIQKRGGTYNHNSINTGRGDTDPGVTDKPVISDLNTEGLNV